MATELVIYREPGWFAKELRQAFGMKALGVTDEDVKRIVNDADFRARNEKTPLSAADRSALRSALIAEATTSVLRWYEPGRGTSPRTYANRVMDAQGPTLVAALVSQALNEQPILDATVDADDPLAPTFAERVPDRREGLLSRCLPSCDWEMVAAFLTPVEFWILEARLHNVPRAVIRRELGFTPGVWKRVWRNFQRRAAFILDLEK